MQAKLAVHDFVTRKQHPSGHRLEVAPLRVAAAAGVPGWSPRASTGALSLPDVVHQFRAAVRAVLGDLAVAPSSAEEADAGTPFPFRASYRAWYTIVQACLYAVVN